MGHGQVNHTCVICPMTDGLNIPNEKEKRNSAQAERVTDCPKYTSDGQLNRDDARRDLVDAGWLDGGRDVPQHARSRNAIPPLARIAAAPAGGNPGPGTNVAEDGEDGEAATSISRDLAVGLETPMLDVRILAELEVRNRTLHRHCQAPPGVGHVLELPAIQIPALEVRTRA
jgi:hypothetical protein